MELRAVVAHADDLPHCNITSREVYERTGDKPFERIESVISAQELAALSEHYKRVAGYDKRSLQR